MAKLRKLRLQFRLRTLLCLVAVIALGWWWVVWPSATAHRFVQGEIERTPDPPRRLPAYFVSQSDPDGFRQMVNKSAGSVTIKMHSRDIYDILSARATCIAHAKEGGYYRFWVRRGKVVNGPNPIFYYGGHELMLDVF